MRKYEKGDRVRLTRALTETGVPVGAIGTVAEDNNSDACRVQFEIDELTYERTVLKHFLEPA